MKETKSLNEKSYKPVWYTLSFLGIFFIALLVSGATGYTNLELTLLYGNNANQLNITNASYIEANYFVGDGSLLTNLSVNTSGNDTLQSVTDRGAVTTTGAIFNSDKNNDDFAVWGGAGLRDEMIFVNALQDRVQLAKDKNGWMDTYGAGIVEIGGTVDLISDKPSLRLSSIDPNGAGGNVWNLFKASMTSNITGVSLDVATIGVLAGGTPSTGFMWGSAMGDGAYTTSTYRVTDEDTFELGRTLAGATPISAVAEDTKLQIFGDYTGSGTKDYFAITSDYESGNVNKGDIFVVDENGNIGIGEQTPTTPLDINGSAPSTTQGVLNIYGEHTDAYNPLISLSKESMGGGVDSWGIGVGDSGQYDGYFYIKRNEQIANGDFYMTASGAAGFGSGLLINDGRSVGSQTSSSLAFWKPYDGGSESLFSFRSAGGTNQRARMNFQSYYYDGSLNAIPSVMALSGNTNGGTVGINGDETPDANLEIVNTAGFPALMISSIPSTDGDLFKVDTDGNTTIGGTITLNGTTIDSWSDVNQSINADCPSGEVVQNISSGSVECVPLPAETSPAGSDKQIQFNNGGSFGASSNFTYDNNNSLLKIGGLVNNPDYDPLICSFIPEPLFCDEYILSALEIRANNNTFVYSAGNWEVQGNNNFVFGKDVNITREDNINFGSNTIKTKGNIVQGNNNNINEKSSEQDYSNTVFGSGNTIESRESFVGGSTNTLNNSIRGIVIGYGNTIENPNFKYNNILIGSGLEAKEDYSILLGRAINNEGRYSYQIGQNLNNYGDFSILLGQNIESYQDYTYSFGSANFETPFLVNKTNTFNFGFNFGSGQQNLLEAEYDKGVRIGATSGETNTMTGDDLYVADNVEIAGALALGTNTWDGLSNGDINASTIYYDVLQAKSPLVMCSDMNCKVEVPELKETYYVERDNNYNILNFDKLLPQVVTDKFNELKAKKLTDDARTSCLAQGRFYEFNNNNCQLNVKSQCESDGKSFWTGSKCLENPYLACEQSLNTSWNLITNSCQFDAEKECTQELEWNWNPQTNQCTKPIIPEKTLKQMQRECLADASTMWDNTNNECIELRLYLAEPYKQPTGAHDAYQIGDLVKWNNKYYESVINANVWSPSAYPAGWMEI